MKTLLLPIVAVLLITSCATNYDYHYHKGLTFDSQDWLKDKKLERPFIINSSVSQKCEDSEEFLYLPAKLFKNTTIEEVYFEDMVSNEITLIDGDKPRYKVRFSFPDHMNEELTYDLNKDQAVIKINSVGKNKTILIKDIRIPYENITVAKN